MFSTLAFIDTLEKIHGYAWLMATFPEKIKFELRKSSKTIKQGSEGEQGGSAGEWERGASGGEGGWWWGTGTRREPSFSDTL